MRGVRQTFAVDLGSSTLRLCGGPSGKPLCVPSVTALDASGRLRAWGAKAAVLIGRAPDSLRILHPFERGIVAHQSAGVLLLRAALLESQALRTLRDTRAVVCMPDAATPLQRQALINLCHEAGLRHVTPVAKSLADLVGHGLPSVDPAGALLVDVGAQHTSVSLLSMGHPFCTRSLPRGGHCVNQALLRHLREEHGLTAGENSTEKLKIQCYAGPVEGRIPVRGKDLIRGGPLTRHLTLRTLSELAMPLYTAVTRLVESVLADSPAELAHDVLDRGVLLSGRGALVPGLAEYLRHHARIPVHTPAPEGTAGVLGAQQLAFVSTRRDRMPACSRA